jgi:hypothetical protein
MKAIQQLMLRAGKRFVEPAAKQTPDTEIRCPALL